MGAFKAGASQAYCTPARVNNDNMTFEFFQGVEAVKHQGYIVFTRKVKTTQKFLPVLRILILQLGMGR